MEASNQLDDSLSADGGGVDESACNYASMVEEAVVGIFQTTPAGRFRYANNAMAKILNYKDEDELLAQVTESATDIFVDPSGPTKVIESLKAPGRLHDDYQASRKGKSDTLWLAFTSRAVIRADGDVDFFEGYV